MAQHTPDKGNLESQSKSTSSSIFITGGILVLSIMIVFLLGLYVIGPWLSSTRKDVNTTVVTTAPDLDPGQTAPLPYRPAPRRNFTSTPSVTITERAPKVKDVNSTNTDTTTVEPELKLPADNIDQPKEPAGDDNSSPDTPAEILPEAEQAPSPVATPQPVDQVEILHKVRAGLFSDRANADMLATRLSQNGFTPAVSPVEISGRLLYSVQVGAFKNRSSADALADSLRKTGFQATVIDSK